MEPTAKKKKKCNLFPALRAMETADNVTGKYEDCRDGTKQRTIYVWNIKFKKREEKKKPREFS